MGPYASALIKGSKIGPSAHFAHSHGQITIERKSHSGSTFGYGGNWYYVGPNRFLGVKFLIHGGTHYGWIRLTVDIPGSFASTITGYAYETTANKPITAGSNDYWRRRQSRNTKQTLRSISWNAGARRGRDAIVATRGMECFTRAIND